MDETNFASLSPTLLARKGGAKPAMRPQITPLNVGSAAESLEDLGWNDMGEEDAAARHDAEVAHLTPAPANPDTAAEAQALDQQSQAALADAPVKTPEVHRQQQALSEKLTSTNDTAQPRSASLLADKKPAAQPPLPTSSAPARKRRSALDRGKRAAFTLRLDAERHFKLRLACTLRSRSAQQLVTDALDELLGEMPDVDSLAAQLRGQGETA
ncbi:hypothetical protein [Pontixanthobacter aquaemixtae]|uniref:Uncharacterized protein n=1 Tax=Pontixanthobacter aquaemixtae TaxID=1958940 RepID=A0A844ZQX0_9SPHN|nr:hypothetical protein [Pontixanthobacter aquaemixtae]MXO89416.1 hypothetical protein [Pontixanthobacter aquaemixtae]